MTDVFNDQEMVIMFFGIIAMVAALIAWYFLHDSDVINQQNPQSDAEMEARVAKRRLSNPSEDDTWYDEDDWNDLINNPLNVGHLGNIANSHD